MIWNLQKLNAVTIRDAGTPPRIDEVIEDFAGYSIYTYTYMKDGYYHGLLAEESRDLTTIQTPLGTFRLKRLPIGATNAVSMFHGDLVFILQDEIPHKAAVFIDD